MQDGPEQQEHGSGDPESRDQATSPETLQSVSSTGSIASDLRNRIFYTRYLERVKQNLAGKALIMLGPPSSGKGTQSEKIVERTGCVTVSTGQLLRSAMEADPDLKARIDETMKQGGFVDDATVKQLLIDKLSTTDLSRGVILDGFPRTESQARELPAILEAAGIELLGVAELDVSLDEALRRMHERVKASEEKREDDKEETLRKRYGRYEAAKAAIKSELSDMPHLSIAAEGSKVTTHRRMIAGLAKLAA